MKSESLDRDGCLHQGWMVKSPPQHPPSHPAYPLIRKRWRRRWFVLHATKMPRQFALSYFTDESRRRLKGTICLDDCEQVDKGLTDHNGKYRHMFNIKTPKRIYYLAVDSNEEMDTWVRMVCSACGLRPTDDDELGASRDSASLRTSLHISSPYIHISECYTGTRSDASSSQHSPSRIGSDVTDEPHWEQLSGRAPQRGATSAWSGSLPSPPEVTVSSLKIAPQPDLEVLPPDRPPKPAHLSHIPSVDSTSGWRSTGQADNYANALDMQQAVSLISGQQPQPHEFNNNQPESGSSPSSTSRTSPQSKATVQSDAASSGPSVMRSLKPGRKGLASGAMTIAGWHLTSHHKKQQATFSSSCTLGPPVQRALKPKSSVMMNAASSFSVFRSCKNSFHSRDDDSSEADSNSEEWPTKRSPGSGPGFDSGEQIYYYMPSISATSTLGGRNAPLMIPAECFERPALEYIDLDLDSRQRRDMSGAGAERLTLRMPSSRWTEAVLPEDTDQSPKTIYKTIDIEKTEAFNRTKKERAEENKRQKSDRAKK